jgi:hypothetical protein
MCGVVERLYETHRQRATNRMQEQLAEMGGF